MPEPLQLPAPERYKDWRVLSEDEKQDMVMGDEVEVIYTEGVLVGQPLPAKGSLSDYKGKTIIVPPDYGKQQESERNADRDSKEDMKAVQDKYGVGSIERLDDGVWLAFHKWDFDAPVKCYRITAKHAKVFDPKTMDAEMFARAAIGAGDMLKVTDGNKTRWCNSCDSVSVWHNRAQYSYPYFAWNDLLVERKTRAEYEQETANGPSNTIYTDELRQDAQEKFIEDKLVGEKSVPKSDIKPENLLRDALEKIVHSDDNLCRCYACKVGKKALAQYAEYEYEQETKKAPAMPITHIRCMVEGQGNDVWMSIAEVRRQMEGGEQ